MAILCRILLVLLCILGAVLLLIILLLSVRTGVEVVGVDGEIEVNARYGAVSVRVLPRPKHLKRKPPKPTKQKAEKMEKPEKPRKYRYVFQREALEIDEILDLMLRLLHHLTGKLQFTRLHARVIFGTNNAVTTAKLLGSTSAAMGVLVPALENTFDMKDYHIKLDADFEAVQTRWALSMLLACRPVLLIWVVLRHIPEGLRLYKKLFKKEAIVNE